MNKEAFYDEQIASLMARIIALCKERQIAFLATFELDESEEAEGTPLRCTSAFMPEGTSEKLVRVRDLVMSGSEEPWATLEIFRKPD